jgi:hypothetical protein
LAAHTIDIQRLPSNEWAVAESAFELHEPAGRVHLVVDVTPETAPIRVSRADIVPDVTATLNGLKQRIEAAMAENGQASHFLEPRH